MRVLDVILEQAPTLNNSEDLAKAFSPGQWFNIISHFASIGNKPLDNATFKSINSTIGKDMPTIVSPAEWDRKASLYKMDTPNNAGSWADIYNHLKPFADKEAAKAPPEDKPTPKLNPLPTKETFQVFQSWARGPESFSDRNELKNYIVSLSKAISAKRGSAFDQFINAQGPNNTVNRYHSDFIKVVTEMLDNVSADKPITKNDVDSKIFAWLNTVDHAISKIQKPQN